MNSFCDHPFERLGLSPRPYYSDAEIRQAFQEQSRRCHPGSLGRAEKPNGDAESFVMLNAAYTLVRDPVQRLRVLAEQWEEWEKSQVQLTEKLEQLPKVQRIQDAPFAQEFTDRMHALQGLGFQVGEVLQKGQQLMTFLQTPSSLAPLLQLLSAQSQVQHVLQWTQEQRQCVQGELAVTQAHLEHIDREWSGYPDSRISLCTPSVLRMLAQQLLFLKKWDKELQEQEFQLRSRQPQPRRQTT